MQISEENTKTDLLTSIFPYFPLRKGNYLEYTTDQFSRYLISALKSSEIEISEDLHFSMELPYRNLLSSAFEIVDFQRFLKVFRFVQQLFPYKLLRPSGNYVLGNKNLFLL